MECSRKSRYRGFLRMIFNVLLDNYFIKKREEVWRENNFLKW